MASIVETILPIKKYLYFKVSERMLFICIWILKLPNDKNVKIRSDFKVFDEMIDVEKIPFVKSNMEFIVMYSIGDKSI